MTRAAILGLGPHGERPSPPESVTLREVDPDLVRKAGLRAAIVLHTARSDHAKQHLAGLVATLGRYGVAVTEVVDCAFDPAVQTRALERVARARVDAIVSLPLTGVETAEAHRRASACGIKLILIDNSPTSLLPGTDYACLVSADNFGLGEIAARLLAPHVAPGGSIGVVSYKLDFFASAQREIAFRRWMETSRPDLVIRTIKFARFGDVASALAEAIGAGPDLSGLFVVWDTPAREALSALAGLGRSLPMTTVDLGADIAVALAAGQVQGVAAQRPYDQGVTTGMATIAALLSLDLPPWVALPAMEVTRDNVVSAFQAIWHRPAPGTLIDLARRSPGKGGAA
jgi:ribose transport system substrate-binding protein